MASKMTKTSRAWKSGSRGSVELWAVATLAGYGAMAAVAIVAVQKFTAMDTASIAKLVEALR